MARDLKIHSTVALKSTQERLQALILRVAGIRFHKLTFSHVACTLHLPFEIVALMLKFFSTSMEQTKRFDSYFNLLNICLGMHPFPAG